MIRAGDIVSRNSYNNDIDFYVKEIFIDEKNRKIAILKGVTVRIEADSLIEDLKLSDATTINNEQDLSKRLFNNFVPDKKINGYGKILHLDGDRRYSEKTNIYYKRHSLNYVVKHIAEQKQSFVVKEYIERYKPNIIVFTGHDGMIKRGKNYNDINNYRNSKYFVDAVKAARSVNPNKDELIIYAGACQSYYEELISAGANFASSPARILIDFMDPLIVAEMVSKTARNRYVTMYDIEGKIRNGRRAISGIGGLGTML